MFKKRERFSVNNGTLYIVVAGVSITVVLLCCLLILLLMLFLIVAAVLRICVGLGSAWRPVGLPLPPYWLLTYVLPL